MVGPCSGLLFEGLRATGLRHRPGQARCAHEHQGGACVAGRTPLALTDCSLRSSPTATLDRVLDSCAGGAGPSHGPTPRARAGSSTDWRHVPPLVGGGAGDFD